jgi:NADPH-dependent ferric siderophore reductase
MTFSRKLTSTIGLGFIASLALTSCNQPTPQATIPNSSAPTTNVPATNTPAPTISVDDAADRVDDALDNDSNLRVFDLDADDENNVIVLKGQVQNQSQKDLAQTLATQAAPGFSIVNRIAF